MAKSKKQSAREYYLRNSQTIREKSKAWKASNREKVSELQQVYRKRMLAADPEWERKSQYRKRYSLTLEQYDAMLTAQDNSCAICCGPPRGRLRYHVDHNHQTGKVRGLLCWRCNAALGNLDESVDVLTRMIAYLTTH